MTENTRVCPFCGAKIQPEARFCGYCGGPLEGAQYQPPTAALPDDPAPLFAPLSSPPPPSSFQQPLPPVDDPGAGTVPPPGYGMPPAPPASRRNGFLIAGIIAAILVSCACACVALSLVFSAQRSYSSRSIFPGGLPMPVEITPGAIQIPDIIQLTSEVEITVVAPAEIQSTAEAVATQIAEGLGTLTAPLEDTPEPAGEAAPTDAGTTSGMEAYSHGNVSFQYEPSLATGVTAKTVDESKGQDRPFWEIYPKHDQFVLEGYPVPGSNMLPQVFIYPVDEYAKLSPDAEKTINALKDVLKTKPADVKSGGKLPFLPSMNDEPIVVVQSKYFDNGVRYITKFSQGPTPVTNDGLFYTYQGFAGDGKYYVSVMLPVKTAVLPDSSSLSGADYDKFLKNFTQYLTDLATKLNKQLPDGFSPNLDTLDEFVQSIQVE